MEKKVRKDVGFLYRPDYVNKFAVTCVCSFALLVEGDR